MEKTHAALVQYQEHKQMLALTRYGMQQVTFTKWLTATSLMSSINYKLVIT